MNAEQLRQITNFETKATKRYKTPIFITEAREMKAGETLFVSMEVYDAEKLKSRYDSYCSVALNKRGGAKQYSIRTLKDKSGFMIIKK